MKKFVIINEALEREMSAHIKKYRSSGLSQIEYCRRTNLGYAKLVYWMRKERVAKKSLALT